MGWCGAEVLDPIDNVVGHIGAGVLGVITDDEPHSGLTPKEASVIRREKLKMVRMEHEGA